MMKHHITDNITKGKERNLKAFSKAMFNLIEFKSFDDITVSEICDESHFPRATFYNYFYDKFDLMNYCWHLMSKDIDMDIHSDMKSEEVLLNAFDGLYSLFEDNQVSVKKILRHNTCESQLITSFSNFLNQSIKAEMSRCLNNKDLSLPVGLISNHYSNTIMLLLEWIFVDNNKMTIDKAHMYLKSLLNHQFESPLNVIH
ncbi:TetR/AcrR family transcriptional regulator [Corticicoccus populi]|uniref:TetR/AcrR family transcriptional regulator n=1 Tax=Corticicoccus populi TaxID=1812821 RepID=A0ABW5WXV8_9STAP